jgi:hypothetical protein
MRIVRNTNTLFQANGHSIAGVPVTRVNILFQSGGKSLEESANLLLSALKADGATILSITSEASLPLGGM